MSDEQAQSDSATPDTTAAAAAPPANPDLEYLTARLGDYFTGAEISAEGDVRLAVPAARLLPLCESLKSDPALSFHYPADLTARDTGDEFILWYRLVSVTRNKTVLLRVSVPRDNPSVPSVTGVWPGMDWHERESFDLFGIRFEGHPDQDDPARMRLLLPEDWIGHPFRKDYEPVFEGNPLHGPQETN